MGLGFGGRDPIRASIAMRIRPARKGQVPRGGRRGAGVSLHCVDVTARTGGGRFQS